MAANTQNNDVEIKSQSTDTPEDCVLSFSAKQINLNKNFAMEPCRKCGSELSDRDLSCPNCGASLSLDVSLSVAAMKVLGVLCGVVGVALLVYAEEIDVLIPTGFGSGQVPSL